MRALVQRVSSASVSISGEIVGTIGPGLVVLIAVGNGDVDKDAQYLVDKITKLRVFPGDNGRFDHSAIDLGLPLLIISQFTLYGDTRRGNRPSFKSAAAPKDAVKIFHNVLSRFRATGLPTESGEFGADMDLALINTGPVTIWIDSSERRNPRS